MNPRDDTNYDHTDIRCVVRRIAKDNPYMFNYYNKEFLRRNENNLYYIPTVAKVHYTNLFTDQEKQYWGNRVSQLKKELRIYYTHAVDRNIIAFSNGAFDMTTLSFRKYVDGDFVSHTTGRNYKPADQVKKQWLMNTLLSIFENREKLDFLLKTLSQVLGWKKQVILFYEGCGKGLLLTIIQKALNNNWGFLFNKYDVDRRILVDGFEKKAVSYCRKNPPNCTIILDSARYYKIEGCIEIKFPLVFIDNPIKPNERKANTKLKHEVAECADEFFEILVDYYKM